MDLTPIWPLVFEELSDDELLLKQEMEKRDGRMVRHMILVNTDAIPAVIRSMQRFYDVRRNGAEEDE